MAKSVLTKYFSKWRHSNKGKSKAVCVLGSGRCGTSMVTRAINFLGVDLGSDFIKPNRTNPKGFFENKKIVTVHKKIKAELGKRPFPAGWENRENIQPFKNELKEIIKDEFLSKKLWGWKDPRTSESIALWKEILRELDISANYIIMIRNPIDVAASYKEAYKRKEDSAIKQWKMRTLLSLKETKEEKRVVVDYDDFLEDSLECLRKISSTFDLPWPQNEVGLKNDLDSFIDPKLQHSRTSLEELMKQEDIDKDTKELYQICLKASRDPEYFQSEPFNFRIDELYRSFLNR